MPWGQDLPNFMVLQNHMEYHVRSSHLCSLKIAGTFGNESSLVVGGGGVCRKRTEGGRKPAGQAQLCIKTGLSATVRWMRLSVMSSSVEVCAAWFHPSCPLSQRPFLKLLQRAGNSPSLGRARSLWFPHLGSGPGGSCTLPVWVGAGQRDWWPGPSRALLVGGGWTEGCLCRDRL